jgi:molybdopterin molybdotransferase
VLGLAAAAGHDALLVHPLPRVAALVTGDELLERGLPGGAHVRDALGPQLGRLVAGCGGLLTARSHVPDDAGLLLRAVAEADAEVVLTTGASSVGPADHLHRVLVELGAEVLVDGVACRPGHPQLLARLPDGRTVVGLPGNPLAAVVAAVTVLAPLLAAAAGRAPVAARTGLLATAVRSAPDATRLLPVRLSGLHAEPVRHTGSGMLRGAALADALAVVLPGAAGAAGDEVELLPLP